jgi:hypothetical protein
MAVFSSIGEVGLGIAVAAPVVTRVSVEADVGRPPVPPACGSAVPGAGDPQPAKMTAKINQKMGKNIPRFIPDFIWSLPLAF